MTFEPKTKAHTTTVWKDKSLSALWKIYVNVKLS